MSCWCTFSIFCLLRKHFNQADDSVEIILYIPYRATLPPWGSMGEVGGAIDHQHHQEGPVSNWTITLTQSE